MSSGERSTPVTVTIAGVAVFSSLALVLGALSQALGLNFPLVPYLQFDLGEVAIVLAFFIVGPEAGLLASLVEFGGLMVFGQQIPVGPLLKLFALTSSVGGLWVGSRVAKGMGLGRLVGSGGLAACLLRAAVMTVPNFYLIVFLYSVPAIEGFVGGSFALVGITLSGANTLWVVLVFTAVFNVLQMAFVTGASYLVLRVGSVQTLRVGARAPWFVRAMTAARV